MEMWDLYDKARAHTGITMRRGDAQPSGGYAMVCCVAVFNSRGEMLIQQRAAQKDTNANRWDITAAGSAQAGDNSQQAAARELLEEVGICYDFGEQPPHFTITKDTAFFDFYLVGLDVDIDTIQLQADEVQRVRWASRSEISRLIVRGEFIPIYDNLIGLMFDMHTNGVMGSCWV